MKLDAVFIPITFVGAFLLFLGLMHVGCFLYIETNQWLKQEDVRYDFWHFFIAWDNAFCWLWYHAWTKWLIFASIYAVIISVLVTLFLSL